MDTVITDDELKANISENLNRILDQHGMSRYVLSKKTGESEQTIKNVADGLHVPRSGILARIAEAVGVSVDDLIKHPKPIRKSGKKFQNVA